jgi:hemolysin III|nr:hemolysin III family protein [Candidatus Krumholzibacteria bacterium]
MRGAFDHKNFSVGEEIAHAITHGIGALGSVVGLVLLIVKAAKAGGPQLVVGVTIFGSSLVLLFLASTLYHALVPGKAKRVFELLDYAAIYVLIAGSYTPFTLSVLGGGWGWSIFGMAWGLAVLGILYEVVLKRPSAKLSLAFYLLMGWLMIIAIKPLSTVLDPKALILIGAGGVAYTGGAVFYAWRGFPYHHALWHLFVLIGSTCHYLSVYLYVIP